MPNLDSSFQPSTPTKMKTPIITKLHTAAIARGVFVGALAFTLTFGAGVARADETCSSPYLARIDGQEEFVYVWTLGVEGLGDGADKLVTVDVKPGSPTYGKSSAALPLRAATRRTTAGSPMTGVNSGSPALKTAASSSSTCILIRQNRDT